VELTVVIPSFGLDALLRTCLASLATSLQVAGIDDVRVVVADNGSTNPYRVEHLGGGRVELLRFDQRTSFARACNMAARSAPARRYLFLNNDVLLHPQAIADVVGTMDAVRNAGICGARLVFPDDRIQHCGVRMDDGPLGPYHEFAGQPTARVSRAIRDFPAVTGAVLLIDGQLFDELGGFDEIYPFGYEDLDLCLRAGQKGARITCAQAIDSLHFESMSNRDPGRHDLSRQQFWQRWKGRYTRVGSWQPP